MPNYRSEDIRNIALVGQAGGGKTTLVEALLHKGGAIATVGTVEKGNTVCDYETQEQQLQHSLDVSFASVDHQGRHINLVDTPGFPDFIGRSISALPAVETAAVTIDAQLGIDHMTQRMMELAGDRGLCRAILVNKIDADGVDLQALLGHIRDAFGTECLPLNLPANGGQSVVDCFFRPSGGDTDFSSVEEAHTQIVDQVVEVDEELMEIYLEQGEELSPEQLHDPFEKALRQGHLIPVCFVSAQSGAGLEQLLEVLTRLMPNPAEGNPPPFLKGEGADATAV
ncbi:MAG: GTP-binding protein, partial [Gammaproteobacteria bacterium]|nr:GTP-binding protein [Gammaproteobacteria bacterium]